MRNITLFRRVLRPLSVLAIVAPAVTASGADPLAVHADTLAGKLAQNGTLPPPDKGVTELKFRDVYRLPAGPQGMTFTEEVRGLDGRRVRVLGFMVRQQRATPGVMMLAPFPLTTSENEYGLSDDLPPTVIFVSVPKYSDIAVPFTPGPLLLTGTLALGPREEADGRVSHIRLQLDREPGAAAVSSH